ncbi:PRD domain-containing protein [Bacillus ndiopicus]|uniref:PRD domain-containing protein n=1 Tax=Bacillus ndiopicus TaxID=1347368 RepID=UPI0005A79719|nr:PRD domain-containing protein [Bacillus ndiopicus]
MTALDMEKIIEKSGDAARCRELLAATKEIIAQAEVVMNETQWLSLASHLSAMLYRSINKEPIQPLDSTMFSEVSQESIKLAATVCGLLPDLHEDEKYLLSIHFEAAKINN